MFHRCPSSDPSSLRMESTIHRLPRRVNLSSSSMRTCCHRRAVSEQQTRASGVRAEASWMSPAVRRPPTRMMKTRKCQCDRQQPLEVLVEAPGLGLKSPRRLHRHHALDDTALHRLRISRGEHLPSMHALCLRFRKSRNQREQHQSGRDTARSHLRHSANLVVTRVHFLPTMCSSLAALHHPHHHRPRAVATRNAEGRL